VYRDDIAKREEGNLKKKSGGKSAGRQTVFIYRGGKETVSKTTLKSRGSRQPRSGEEAKLLDQVSSPEDEVIATVTSPMDREQSWTKNK